MPSAETPSPAQIRPATPADLGSVLRLNSEWEHVTSRLDEVSLTQLHESAAYHRVCERDGQVAAFLLALGPGVDYDSPNYRWFDSGDRDFIYIDRIVVAGEHHRAGLGNALYDDLLAFARQGGVARLCCEVDVEPLNQGSDRFHARHGFVEVGTQWVAGGSKRVSLRERVLG